MPLACLVAAILLILSRPSASKSPQAAALRKESQFLSKLSLLIPYLGTTALSLSSLTAKVVQEKARSLCFLLTLDFDRYCVVRCRVVQCDIHDEFIVSVEGESGHLFDDIAKVTQRRVTSLVIATWRPERDKCIEMDSLSVPM